jgi:hypothetical protein
MVWQEVCHLLPDVRSKTLEAKKKDIMHFTKSMGLNHCAANHTAQTNFHKMKEDLEHFIEFMKDKVVGKDCCDSININQSLIPYSFHSSKTLETKGARKIHVCMSTTKTK